MPSGGSRLAWLGTDDRVYVATLDCDDQLAGSPLSFPANDFQDIHADDDGGVGADTTQVTVSNVAPVVEAGAAQSTLEGTVISLAPSTFTDVGVLDTHTAVIDWGDGTVVAGAVSQGAGSGSVAGSHAYADNGTYTVKVTVTDDDGGTHSDSFAVTVANVAPSATPAESDTKIRTERIVIVSFRPP